jgi:hypothetical protein
MTAKFYWLAAKFYYMTARWLLDPDSWLLNYARWLLDNLWSLGQWIGRIGMVWSQCRRAARPWIFQRFEKVFFCFFWTEHFINIFFFSFLILSIVESTEVLIYCTIVHKGGLALNSILLNKRHTYIHTYFLTLSDSAKWLLDSVRSVLNYVR